MPDLDPLVRYLKVRISRAIWGMTASTVLLVSLALPWVHLDFGVTTVPISDELVWDIPTMLSGAWLPWAVPGLAALSVLAAAHPNTITSVTACLAAGVTAVLQARFLQSFQGHDAAHPGPGLVAAAAGALLVLLTFLPTIWRGSQPTTGSADPYTHIEY